MSLKSFAPNSPPEEEQDFKKWWIRPGRRHWIDPSPLFIICTRSRETSAASWQMGRLQEERIKKSRLQFSLLPISRPPPSPPPTHRASPLTSLVKGRNIDNWVRVRKRQEIRVKRNEEHLKWWASRLSGRSTERAGHLRTQQITRRKNFKFFRNSNKLWRLLLEANESSEDAEGQWASVDN